jgi:Zn-dependent protease with chaperone function
MFDKVTKAERGKVISTVAAPAAPWKPKKGALPPWIILALVFSILGLPTQVQSLLSDWGPITSVLSNQLLWLARVQSIVDLAMALVLYAGVAVVFLPWVRRVVFVEFKYRRVIDWKNARASHLERLTEIHKFLQECAPDVCLKYATKRSHGEYAMLYPADYRRVIIAVFPNMLDLWYQNRQKAEAVLFHEIGHYRHGDALFIGAGSVLEYAIRYWFHLNVIFSLLPIAIGLVLGQRDALDLARHLQLPCEQTIFFSVQQLFTMGLPFAGLAFLRSLFWSGALFILLGVGVWCAELNADRFMADVYGAEALLTDEMEQTAQKQLSQREAMASRIGRLFLYGPLWSDQWHHPPQSMRLWVARRSQKLRGWLSLLLLFPVAFLARWASAVATLNKAD